MVSVWSMKVSIAQSRPIPLQPLPEKPVVERCVIVSIAQSRPIPLQHLVPSPVVSVSRMVSIAQSRPIPLQPPKARCQSCGSILFQSLNRAQSLYNGEGAKVQQRIQRVSIAQSRPIPLQPQLLAKLMDTAAGFNRSIAPNPSTTLARMALQLSSSQFQSLNRAQSLYN